MMRRFNFDGLGSIDAGKAKIAIDSALQSAAADIDNRPMEGRARKVTIEVFLAPKTDQQGECERVASQVKVSLSLPKQQSTVYELGLRRGGMLTFNEDSLDHVDQGTFLPESDT